MNANNEKPRWFFYPTWINLGYLPCFFTNLRHGSGVSSANESS